MLKFPKVKRIPLGKQALIGRNVMTLPEAKKLLSGEVVIEEKLDGKTVATDLYPGYIIYGEYMRFKHSIQYDKLPAWIVGFDVYDLTTKKFLPRKKKQLILNIVGIPCVPLIFQGHIAKLSELTKFLKRKSRFSVSSNLEGIVVKNYSNQLMGKLVRYEFLKGIEKHWTKQPMVENALSGLPMASPLAMSLNGWKYA